MAEKFRAGLDAPPVYNPPRGLSNGRRDEQPCAERGVGDGADRCCVAAILCRSWNIFRARNVSGPKLVVADHSATQDIRQGGRQGGRNAGLRAGEIRQHPAMITVWSSAGARQDTEKIHPAIIPSAPSIFAYSSNPHLCSSCSNLREIWLKSPRWSPTFSSDRTPHGDNRFPTGPMRSTLVSSRTLP
jgi:hypothetical protein